MPALLSPIPCDWLKNYGPHETEENVSSIVRSIIFSTSRAAILDELDRSSIEKQWYALIYYHLGLDRGLGRKEVVETALGRKERISEILRSRDPFGNWRDAYKNFFWVFWGEAERRLFGRERGERIFAVEDEEEEDSWIMIKRDSGSLTHSQALILGILPTSDSTSASKEREPPTLTHWHNPLEVNARSQSAVLAWPWDGHV